MAPFEVGKNVGEGLAGVVTRSWRDWIRHWMTTCGGAYVEYHRITGQVQRLWRAGHSDSRMPELPDISAYLTALELRIVGQTLEKVRLANPFLLRTVQPPITDIEGLTVRQLRRIGKRIAIGFDNHLWLVLHLMIAGRLHWRPKDAKL